MERRAESPMLAQAAALARIEEVASRMGAQGTPRPQEHELAQSPKELARTMWALGDYHDFALRTVWEVGPVLVRACGISPGQRVLDVAAGTGNVAIRAAEAGAHVVAADLTPENFEAGRREAAAHGVEVEWVEADAEALPFEDAAFDVVTSSFGAMFAPDQREVASELVRVCRPGGTIGLASFTPEGLGGDFFATLAPYLPAPPPGASSPLLWGSEEHVRALFGEGVASLETTRLEYVERAESPAEYRELFEATFGPVVALLASLPPERAAELRRDLLAYSTRANTGEPGEPAAYPYEYLLVVARTRTA